ncbi:MAG TPA: TlpA disulfide reductase family protein [Gemmatimonadales bacterium]|nr:TlpA disulfide reductase family protein [Gemmatimonadales bacterium]
MSILPRVRGWVKLLGLAVAAVVVTQLLVRTATPSLALGEAAPPLALADLEGRPLALQGLRGRVVLVNFWATWCAPCLAEIPELAEAWREQRGRCLEILGVAEESGTPAEVAEFARRHAIPYRLVLDRDGKAAADWRVPGYPRSYLVDREGRVQRVFDGALSRRKLEEAAAPHLAAAGACPGT